MVYAFKSGGIPVLFGDCVQTLLIARQDNGYQVHMRQCHFWPEICQPALLLKHPWHLHQRDHSTNAPNIADDLPERGI